MKKTQYRDCLGTYIITVHNDGKARLRCYYAGKWRENRVYQSERAAKRALAQICGGMPTRCSI